MLLDGSKIYHKTLLCFWIIYMVYFVSGNVPPDCNFIPFVVWRTTNSTSYQWNKMFMLSVVKVLHNYELFCSLVGVIIVSLTLKVPVTTAADNSFFFFFQRKQVDISCESSAMQMIHMKCQDLFSLKNKKKFECRLLQILLGVLRVNIFALVFIHNSRSGAFFFSTEKYWYFSYFSK